MKQDSAKQGALRIALDIGRCRFGPLFGAFGRASQGLRTKYRAGEHLGRGQAPLQRNQVSLQKLIILKTAWRPLSKKWQPIVSQEALGSHIRSRIRQRDRQQTMKRKQTQKKNKQANKQTNKQKRNKETQQIEHLSLTGAAPC